MHPWRASRLLGRSGVTSKPSAGPLSDGTLETPAICWQWPFIGAAAGWGLASGVSPTCVACLTSISNALGRGDDLY